MLFVGLNPSAADECTDDPTIRRCAAFAREWGYGGLLVGNLFAYCATRPEQLKAASDPLGSENDAWLAKLADSAGQLLVCWGNHGAYMDRDRAFAESRTGLYCLGRNKNGSPVHPLYIPGSQSPVPWEI